VHNEAGYQYGLLRTIVSLGEVRSFQYSEETARRHENH